MASTSSNALGKDNILQLMSSSLPQEESTQLKNAYAAIALLCHSCMLAAGFRLIGLGEDHSIEAQSEPSNIRPLPSEWDASSASYAFRYKHPQSAMEYLIKINRLGSKAIIMGVGLGHDRTAQCEAKSEDYISEGSLKDVSSQSPDLKSALQNTFISPGRITDLISLFRSNIIQKLVPGILKEGHEESTTETESSMRRQQQPIRPEAAPERDPLREDQPPPARPYPFDDPLAIPPRRPGPVPDFQPPGFEDEYELQRPQRGMFPSGNEPFGRIGERDLYPPGLGPSDPLRVGPGGGGFRGGGGMHPTFDDPIFGGQQGGNGEGYDPRAPPGARYDPIGPGDGPPGLRGGPRFPGRRGGGPPNPFGGFGSGDFI